MKEEFILQTDKNLPKNINKWGCYFMCLIYTTWDIEDKKHNITVKDILNIYKICIKNKFVDKKLYVKKPLGIISTTINEIFPKSNKKKMELSFVSNYRFPIPNQKIIACWKWKYTHFVVMDIVAENPSKNDVKYDPIGKSKSVENGSINSFRYIEILNK